MQWWQYWYWLVQNVAWKIAQWYWIFNPISYSVGCFCGTILEEDIEQEGSRGPPAVKRC